MSVLVFPDNPTNGQIYPPTAIPGVQQYQWNASTTSWEILDISAKFIPKSIVNATGDLLVGETNDVPAVLPVGNDGDLLVADSGEVLGVKWEAPTPSIPDTIIDAKGDLIVGEANDTPAVLPVGNDGDLLVADSGEVLGVKWEAPPAPAIPESIIDAKGDLIVGEADDTPAVLPVGNDGDLLVADSGEVLGVKWETPVANIPESIIDSKGDLIVGEADDTPAILPIGNDGNVLIADSAELLGVKWAPPPAQPQVIETATFTTNVLAPGQTQEFWLDLGKFFSFISISVLTVPPDAWIRAYTSEAGMIADTRVVPGPPFPSSGSGFAAEVVTSGSEPSVTFLPVPSIFTNDGFFFKLTNLTVNTQFFSLEIDYLATIESDCDIPPFGCNPFVSTGCVTDFSFAWESCTGITFIPQLELNQGTTFESAWQGCSGLINFPAGMFDSCLATNFENAWFDCALSQISVDNILVSLDTAGQLNGVVNLDGGASAPPGVAGLAAKASLEAKGWTVPVNTAPLYCTPAYPSIPVSYPPYSCNTVVNTAGVTDFSNAWDGCYSIVTFPCVDSSSVTSFNSAWSGCDNMVSIPELNSSMVSDFSYAWNHCESLSSFPALDFTNGDNFTYTWGYCYALTSFPGVNLGAGSIFYSTWASCYGLTSFPALDMGNGTDFSYAWYSCTGLTSFPAVNVSSGQNFYGTWWYCSDIVSFSLIDTSLGIDFSKAWASCNSLATFPLLDFSLGQTFNYAWQYCYALTSFPAIDFPSATSFVGAWANTGLTSFPNINVSLGQDFGAAWQYCSDMVTFPALSFNSATSLQAAWQYCTSLTSFPAISAPVCLDFTGSWADCSSLTSFSNTNLGSGQIFARAWDNCTSLTSFPACDLSSGTNFFKAWYNCSAMTNFSTVSLGAGVDFDRAWTNCSSLTSFPSADLSSGTNFTSSWEGCTSLTSFPALDVSSGTNFGGAWYNCTSLTSFPALDVSQGTNFNGAWGGCTSLTSFPLLVMSSGLQFGSTWGGCTSLTSFPAIDFSSGTGFPYAWANCTSLTSFPAGLFDSCTSNYFALAWNNCALDQTSVDNILVSIDTSGAIGGSLGISGGTSSAPGVAGAAAKASLISKGWTVTTN